MAEILITRIPNSRDADKAGIELESILDALSAKSTGPYTARVEITRNGFELDGWSFTELETDWYRIIG